MIHLMVGATSPSCSSQRPAGASVVVSWATWATTRAMFLVSEKCIRLPGVPSVKSDRQSVTSEPLLEQAVMSQAKAVADSTSGEAWRQPYRV